MVWPSATPLGTREAPISPPEPSQFSTITDWPRLAVSFAATMGAMVSEAAPGVTPEMRRTVLLGKVCAAAIPDASIAAASKLHLRIVMISPLQAVRSWAAPAARRASRQSGFDSDK